MTTKEDEDEYEDGANSLKTHTITHGNDCVVILTMTMTTLMLI